MVDLNIYLVIYLLLAVLDLCCFEYFSLVSVCYLLVVAASLVAEHGLWGLWALVVV